MSNIKRILGILVLAAGLLFASTASASAGWDQPKWNNPHMDMSKLKHMQVIPQEQAMEYMRILKVQKMENGYDLEYKDHFTKPEHENKVLPNHHGQYYNPVNTVPHVPAVPPVLNNPNVVAYYPDGVHAIPLENIIWLEGHDLVLKLGNSGNFIQWFWNDEVVYKSMWMISHNGCPNGVLFEDPHPEWGDYLVAGADYCVITTQYSI